MVWDQRCETHGQFSKLYCLSVKTNALISDWRQLTASSQIYVDFVKFQRNLVVLAYTFIIWVLRLDYFILLLFKQDINQLHFNWLFFDSVIYQAWLRSSLLWQERCALWQVHREALARVLPWFWLRQELLFTSQVSSNFVYLTKPHLINCYNNMLFWFFWQLLNRS